MLSSTAILRAARRLNLQASTRAFSATAPQSSGHMELADYAEGREFTHPTIGDREIVGWGSCGKEIYFDREDFPYPAIRWKSPNAPGVPELRQKELGDWKALTMDEKKALYRASFCQTFAEFQADRRKSGEWKFWLGSTFIGMALSLVMWIFTKLYVYGPLPSSFSREGQIARLRWEVAIRKDPIDGISSFWDYEKDQWKE